MAPEIDESTQFGEAPLALAQRLAIEKAQRVAQQLIETPEFAKRDRPTWVIGSDQVAVCDGRVYGKPGTHERAVSMLHELSGQELSFHTALCLLNATDPDQLQLDVVTIKARFRHLEHAEIDHYLHAEQPYDCAAAAKSEGLGISLLDYIRGDDDTALIGLPLISLCRMFRHWGFNLPLMAR